MWVCFWVAPEEDLQPVCWSREKNSVSRWKIVLVEIANVIRWSRILMSSLHLSDSRTKSRSRSLKVNKGKYTKSSLIGNSIDRLRWFKYLLTTINGLNNLRTSSIRKRTQRFRNIFDVRTKLVTHWLIETFNRNFWVLKRSTQIDLLLFLSGDRWVNSVNLMIRS